MGYNPPVKGGDKMNTWQWIKLLGGVGYLMVIITAISGIMGIKMKNHKLLALISVILITLHAVLLIIK